MVQYGKLLREILSMTLKNGKNFDRTSKIHNVDKYERVICGYKLGCCPLHLESLNLHLKMAKDETGQAGCSQSVTFLSCKNKEIELSVQFSHSVVSKYLQPTTVGQASLSTTNSWSLPKLMSIESVMPSNHLILCHSLLLLPSIFPSIRVFSNESALRIRWPKYWSFSFNISPPNDLLADQGTLKSLLQHHSSKPSLFGAQLSL